MWNGSVGEERRKGPDVMSETLKGESRGIKRYLWDINGRYEELKYCQYVNKFKCGLLDKVRIHKLNIEQHLYIQ